MESHREVVNLFLEAVNQRSRDGFAAIASDQYVEVPVQPWVHSKSGCLDKSGRRKFGTNARPALKVDVLCDVFLQICKLFFFKCGTLVIAVFPGPQRRWMIQCT